MTRRESRPRSGAPTLHDQTIAIGAMTSTRDAGRSVDDEWQQVEAPLEVLVRASTPARSNIQGASL